MYIPYFLGVTWVFIATPVVCLNALLPYKMLRPNLNDTTNSLARIQKLSSFLMGDGTLGGGLCLVPTVR